MSTAGTAAKQEKMKFFEMVLTSPGMTEDCKISMKISRKNALVLCRLVEYGLLESKKAFEDDVLGALPAEALTDFKILQEEILKKAGLTEFYERLKNL